MRALETIATKKQNISRFVCPLKVKCKKFIKRSREISKKINNTPYLFDVLQFLSEINVIFML